MTRRTQEDRRAETIGRLVEATIDSLYEAGYAATSTYAVCKRAGVSQGALFNHFDKRIDLVVRTTQAICERHLERYAAATRGLSTLDEAEVRVLVEFIRASTRTREHGAWHEVMVAARTDGELRERIASSLSTFEHALLETVTRVFGRAADDPIGVVALSIMHMFDSEAVTASVYPNAKIERERIEWATALLQDELRAASDALS